MNGFRKKNIIEQKEMNPAKWPSTEKRTIKNVLIFMSGKIGLRIWDIITICMLFAYICTSFMVIEEMGILKVIFTGVHFLLIRFGYRLLFMLYYHFRDYTGRLLKNYDACGGRLEHSALLESLEYNLKNRLLYYSRQWIITEKFFLAWCKSDVFFCPVAIPFQEMQSLRLEVRRKHIYSGGTIWNNVIVCQLKNGKCMDLYVGNKFKGNVIAKILQHFSIPFENTLNPKESYEVFEEITATLPNKITTAQPLSPLERSVTIREEFKMNTIEESKNVDRIGKVENVINKCEKFILKAMFCLYTMIGSLGGLFLIVAYGVPLAGFEENQKLVELGLFLFGTAIFIVLIYIGSQVMVTYFDKKRERFDIENNLKKWPSPKKRTLKRTLTYMSRKVGLLVWDILTVCIIVSYLLAFGAEIENTTKFVITVVNSMIFFLAVRLIFMFYYGFRDYTKRLLKNYDKCDGYLRDYVLLERLEDSLQKKLLYYSPQWIITEDFFLAWSKSDLSFSPIAISFQEMRSLRLEVRKGTISSKRVIWNNVIVCQLKNGKSVDLYIGDKCKANVIAQILQYFNISFENTLNQTGIYIPPEEITATSPDKRLLQEKVVATSSHKNTRQEEVFADSFNQERKQEDRWISSFRQSMEQENNFTSSENQMKKEKMAIFASVMNKTTTQDREKILNLLAAGRKIQAIKELREVTGIGLAEAKSIIDQYDLNHTDMKSP